MELFFIAWDIGYTKSGIWGFNPTYLSGIYFFNLPIEEVLFFVCIPYSCLFTYCCLKVFFPIKPSEYTHLITYKLSFALLVAGIKFIPNLYTCVTLISLSFVLFFIQIKDNPIWLPRLYTTLIILIIPFLLVNGILTGSGLENPIVWYNENEITGFRILTIPIEDFAYGMLLLLCITYLFEKFDLQNQK